MPTLTYQRTIEAPPKVVFDLCRSIDFHVQAAQSIKARAVAHRTCGLAELNDKTTYSASFFGSRFKLTTQITRFESPQILHDEMAQGLFHRFSHHYIITESPDGTLLEDDFTFQAPLGPLGRLFEQLLLTKALARAQNERLDAIKSEAENQTSLA
ncbi:MAG: SRPBCC family protein [Verrucomicrobiota bacterium]